MRELAVKCSFHRTLHKVNVNLAIRNSKIEQVDAQNARCCNEMPQVNAISLCYCGVRYLNMTRALSRFGSRRSLYFYRKAYQTIKHTRTPFSQLNR